jgi:tRNA-2-methylthio-N6-dimethylallyladenosine synthase
MSDALLDAMAACDKVCPQLHLPVQSGSDCVLQEMERGYTVEQYLRLVERLRAAKPGIALSTDIIVGFPGESASDFEATLSLMRHVAYDSAFMFKYSARDGTKAAKRLETVSEEEKSRRLQLVIAEQEQRSAAINQQWIGRSVDVLVEGPARRREGWLVGKTPHFKTTIFPALPQARSGEVVGVRIEAATGHTLIGQAA